MAYKKQKNVNIDALIAREDFEAADETTNTASKISTLSVNDLKEGSGLFLASVRKPDFQRETADWEQEKGINIGTIFHRKFRRVLKHSQVQLTDCYLIR